jgi:hypothetical protein
MITLTTGEIATINSKGDWHGGKGRKPKSHRGVPTSGSRVVTYCISNQFIIPICYLRDSCFARLRRCIFVVPLKPIAGPQCPIVQVAARLRLLQELASVKNSIVTLKPEMSINLPMQLHARPVSDKSRLTIACGPDQRSRDRVDSIQDICPPLKNPVDRCGHVVRKCYFDMRVTSMKFSGPGPVVARTPK